MILRYAIAISHWEITSGAVRGEGLTLSDNAISDIGLRYEIVIQYKLLDAGVNRTVDGRSRYLGEGQVICDKAVSGDAMMRLRYRIGRSQDCEMQLRCDKGAIAVERQFAIKQQFTVKAEIYNKTKICNKVEIYNKT